jgi:hypothetical protein
MARFGLDGLKKGGGWPMGVPAGAAVRPWEQKIRQQRK